MRVVATICSTTNPGLMKLKSQACVRSLTIKSSYTSVLCPMCKELFLYMIINLSVSWPPTHHVLILWQCCDYKQKKYRLKHHLGLKLPGESLMMSSVFLVCSGLMVKTVKKKTAHTNREPLGENLAVDTSQRWVTVWREASFFLTPKPVFALKNDGGVRRVEGTTERQ